jgi:hypothetical protein
MNAVSNKFKPKETPQAPKPKDFNKFLFLFALLFILAMYASIEGLDFLSYDAEGEAEISPKRQELLERRLKKLQNSEQYALIASRNDYYPCYNCGSDTLIFLYVGEVWKYGVTIRGEKGRYGAQVRKKQLIYQVQTRGTIYVCLKAEALKIFNYPKLPENLKRTPPIIRPTGNKADL